MVVIFQLEVGKEEMWEKVVDMAMGLSVGSVYGMDCHGLSTGCCSNAVYVAGAMRLGPTLSNKKLRWKHFMGTLTDSFLLGVLSL